MLTNSGEALSALHGIGDEPISERGLQTEAQLADAISVARDESAANLEKMEMEKEWDAIPAAMDEREYGFDEGVAQPERESDSAHEPAKQREQELDFGV